MSSPILVVSGAWNHLPSDGPKITISESGRRVKLERTIGGNGPVCAVVQPFPYSTIASKRYFEVIPLTMSNANNCCVSLGNWNDADGNITTPTDTITYRADGVAYRQDTSAGGTYAAWTTSDIIGVGWDPATGTAYFAKNNTWQNSANPAAGTGGIVATSGAIANMYYMTARFLLGGSTSGIKTWEARICMQAGQQTYSPPSGFVAWDDGSNFDLPATGPGSPVMTHTDGPGTYPAVGAYGTFVTTPTYRKAYGGQMGGTDYIDGTVDIAGVPGSRQVILFDKLTNAMLSSQWSHPTTGYFKFEGVNQYREYFVIGHDYYKVYNGVIQDNLSL